MRINQKRTIISEENEVICTQPPICKKIFRSIDVKNISSASLMKIKVKKYIPFAKREVLNLLTITEIVQNVHLINSICCSVLKLLNFYLIVLNAMCLYLKVEHKIPTLLLVKCK